VVKLGVAEGLSTVQRSLWGDVWRQFYKHKGAVVGVVVFVLIGLSVFFGPYLYDVDPNAIDFRARNLSPNFEHPLGTDNIGRDTMAAMLAGGQVSLAVGFLAMVIALLLGTLVGVLAGFIKALDSPLMRLTDLFLSLPLLPLLLVSIMLFRDPLRTLYGPENGIFILIVFMI
ncbi:uncharacterized protein METZ01_LOCUS259520, partial [marine metagenome]